jgi:hypothetical protein
MISVAASTSGHAEDGPDAARRLLHARRVGRVTCARKSLPALLNEPALPSLRHNKRMEVAA